ncbi:PaaI family thioesterase [Nocardia sp. NBC_01503]|uniref:PaaI family thioesterase n=1 Tax=Nocardia sp. NBC_01503 TaxID=2975997 RepID=UPI002E7B5C74|nr:PaaI family thioesterase [Nocardia sp. NBC_01503]WTL29269.1 PaaI family thioesterase [Nocardia sp. NBC_01503]
MTITTEPPTSPESWGEVRSKSVYWHDPKVSLEAAPGRTGLEYLSAMVNGEIPGAPIAGLMNMRPVQVAAGDVVFACVPDESMYNPIGMVHGGVACTLLDTAAGCAVHSTLAEGVGYTSIEIKINYLRPIHSHTGELTVHGWVTKPGRRVAFAEADIRDADGALLATATSTCLVIGG